MSVVVATGWRGAHGWDTTVFLTINRWSAETRWLHLPLHAAARAGMPVLAALLLAGWWRARRRGPATVAAALWTGLATLTAIALAQPLHPLVAEARPWRELPRALILIGHGARYSFPSGTAVITGAATAGLLLYSRRMALAAAAVGAVSCFGWVYVGAHYPQDILGGLALGATVTLAGYPLARRPLTALAERLAGTRLRPLVTVGPSPARNTLSRTDVHA